MVKEKYRSKQKTRENNSRGDIFRKKTSEPSILESIQNKSNHLALLSVRDPEEAEGVVEAGKSRSLKCQQV